MTGRKTIVELTTPLLATNIDTGWIKIHNEKYITVEGTGYNSETEKVIAMCGKEPSLGLLFLNGNLELGGKVPKVTDVEYWKGEGSKELTNAGYVRRFVFKGDDALDLMDLLYEYQSVGFIMLGECPNSGDFISGKIILDFDTRGLERVMKRIK